jgi:hypothetical protein
LRVLHNLCVNPFSSTDPGVSGMGDLEQKHYYWGKKLDGRTGNIKVDTVTLHVATSVLFPTSNSLKFFLSMHLQMRLGTIDL